MVQRLKVLSFKTVSPLFEMERDGAKPFTVRLFDYKDPRFRALSRIPYSDSPAYKYGFSDRDLWAVKITNPVTGESFTRRLIRWAYLPINPKWVIIYLSDLIPQEAKR